jgi:hypothetical protein
MELSDKEEQAMDSKNSELHRIKFLVGPSNGSCLYEEHRHVCLAMLSRAHRDCN